MRNSLPRMAGNDSEGLRYGTLLTPEKHYLEWKQDGFTQFQEERDETDILIEDVCKSIPNKLDMQIYAMFHKKRFLDLIHNFVIFDTVSDDEETETFEKYNTYLKMIGVDPTEDKTQIATKGGIVVTNLEQKSTTGDMKYKILFALIIIAGVVCKLFWVAFFGLYAIMLQKGRSMEIPSRKRCVIGEDPVWKPFVEKLYYVNALSVWIKFIKKAGDYCEQYQRFCYRRRRTDPIPW